MKSTPAAKKKTGKSTHPRAAAKPKRTTEPEVAPSLTPAPAVSPPDPAPAPSAPPPLPQTDPVPQVPQEETFPSLKSASIAAPAPEPVAPPPPTPSPESASVDRAEATAAYQSKEADRTADPMVLAIQEEIGKSLEASGSLPSESFLKDAYQPDEVFRCTNLTKAYGQGAAYNEVIKGITFTVKEAEYIVIVGPSGSGKSTLLHLLSGLEAPTRGEIRVRNHILEQFSDDDLAYYHREEVGLVFQNFNLIDTLTVWENVAFPLMLAGAPLEWRRHESLRMLDRFHMADFATHYPNQLSGGQQQRVGLARALIHDPAILLIDEPTGNLDSRSADIVIHEIDRLHKQEERTIILVTHSQEFLSYADRVFYIKDGTLLTTEEKENSEQKTQVPVAAN